MKTIFKNIKYKRAIVILLLLSVSLGYTQVSPVQDKDQKDDLPIIQFIPGDGEMTTYYRDADGDHWGNPLVTKKAYVQPSGYVTRSGDCNDNNASIYPKKWHRDKDGDSYGVSHYTMACQPSAGYVNNGRDCNDNDPEIHPGTKWYLDRDLDNYGGTTSFVGCSPPAGSPISGYYRRIAGDCNDNNKNIYPGALEICDGIDNNCSAGIDENKPTVPTVSITNNCGHTILTRGNPPSNTTWYWQGSSSGTSTSNSENSIRRTNGSVYYLRAYNSITKCWSAIKTVNYGINSIPSVPPTPTIINKCEETILTRSNPPGGFTYYWQSSASGSDTSNAAQRISLTSGTTYYLRSRNNSTSCWSGTRAVNYSITPGPKWYADTDGDGFGDPNVSKRQCSQPAGYVSNNNDRCPGESGTQQGCVFTPHELNLSNENYVFTRVYQKPMTSPDEILYNKDVIESVTYFDGLGRAKQQTAIKGSFNQKDIITHIAYDSFGRQDKQYLPFEVNTPVGSYKTVIVKDDINPYYATTYTDDFTGVALPDINAYSQSVFEKSPLNRVLEQGAPGKAWKADPNSNNDHTIKFDWNTNIANEVVYFKVNFANPGNTEVPSLVKDGHYTANDLYVSIIKDENWTPADGHNRTTREYKNKSGQIVLKRTYASTGSATPSAGSATSVAHDTYYVYDDFDNLTYVLSPKVIVDDGVSDTELAELCYQYHYDSRNRLIEKKAPGKDWEYIVYNKLDQPIMTQDASLRKENSGKPWDQWLCTKYDIFGRVIYTGSIINGSNRKIIQNRANASTGPQYETRITTPIAIAGTTTYYSKETYPTSVYKMYTINYHDDYNMPALLQGNALPQDVNSFGVAVDLNAKGLPTVSQTKVLGTNLWITSAVAYDNKGRGIATATRNEYLKTTDVTEFLLDFTGKVEKSKTTHGKDGQAPIVTLDTFTYDHVGRVLIQTQKINAQDEERIFSNEYDALGKLIKKDVGGTVTASGVVAVSPLQQVKYSYNIRGWLKGVNDVNTLGNDLFSLGINYNTTTENLGASALYNGNISETTWKTANDNTKRAYGYQYDALDRITSATSNDTQYSVSNISYDKIGNIMTLNRNGWQNTSNYNNLDVLSYTYDNGNKLLSVTDSGNKAYGFKDGSNTGNDYAYDANGNMTVDNNKNISGIVYNNLNLPARVNVNGGTEYINYVYDATGIKLKKIATTTNGKIFTEYASNCVYKNGTLEFFNHPEGIVEKEADGYKYVYQYKDHLGNIRLSYKDANKDGSISTDEIIQEKNYYPFGLQHKGYNFAKNGRKHNHGFNDQEFDESLGLNVSEMTFRQYAPTIARFMVIDPLAENYHNWTPYRFGFNNPIVWSDPSGLIERSVVNEIYRRSNSKDKWYNDGYSGFYTNSGGYVGYTSDDTSFNRSSGGATILPTVEITQGNYMSYRLAGLKTQSAILSTKWYDYQKQFVSQKKLSLSEKWANSDNLFASMSYGILNDAFQVVQSVDADLIPGRTNPLTGFQTNINIDGSANYKSIDGFANTLTLAIPFARGAKATSAVLPKGLGYLQKFNAAQFSQRFKGNLSRLAPKYRGVLNRYLNKGINTYNNQVSNGLITLKALWFATEDE